MPKVSITQTKQTMRKGHLAQASALIFVLLLIGGFLMMKKEGAFSRWSESAELSMYNKRNNALLLSKDNLRDAKVFIYLRSENSGGITSAKFDHPELVQEFSKIWNQSFEQLVPQSLIRKVRSPGYVDEKESMIESVGLYHRDWLETREGFYVCIQNTRSETFRTCRESNVIWISDKKEFLTKVISFARKHLPEEEKKKILSDWSATE